VWVKPIAVHFDGWATYTYSVQDICATFHHLLATRGENGAVIPDPRAKYQNTRVSFSIFTQKFRLAGDPYPHIVEMPTFGNSDNHAGIQVADLLCSGLLYPIACYSYCTGHVQNVHVNPGFAVLKTRYGVRLRGLQYRYWDGSSARWRGGIVVSDKLAARNGGHLFS
jgi:hypothetical protein